MDNLSDKAQRIKNLKNVNGLQYLLDEAYEILGNPILIHDMEYKILEINKNVVTDDPIWNEYAANGTVDYNWLNFFKNECFLEAAANAKRITFLLSDKLKYDRLFGKLFNKNNIQVGCAVLLACDKPFEADDPMLFDDFCSVLSSEIGRIDFYNDYGQVYFEKLIAELIAGVDNRALYAAHVESIYMHLKSNLYLAVADITKGDSADAGLAYFRDLFKDTQPEYAYAIYGNYILIIIGTSNPVLYVEKDLKRLNRLFYENNIYAGVSSTFENLFELNKYLKEAFDALNSGLEIDDQNIFLYDQFGHEQTD